MTDERAEFSAVYATHLPAVSRYLARRVDASAVEDLAADTFAIAWRRRARVTAGEELPWLYRIASYQVANYRRRLAVAANAMAFLTAPDAAPAADAAFTGDPALSAAWKRLPGPHREVLALVILDDLSVADAAIALGITPNATSIRVHRAKKALAHALEAEMAAAAVSSPVTPRTNSSGAERSASDAT